MLTVRPTTLPDVLIVATRWFDDERGAFSEIFNGPRFAAAGIAAHFIQDNVAVSRRSGTLRGLHFQYPPAAQAKLVRVTQGAVYDVAVDIRQGSPSYGRWVGVELSAANRLQLFVPAGFAHGYLTLAPDTEFAYKVDAPYDPGQEGGIVWNDPDVGIAWPITADGPLLAPRDAALPPLRALPSRGSRDTPR